MNPLTEFIQHTLNSAFFERLDIALPNWEFKRTRGGDWQTTHRLDGTISSTRRPDRSVVTRKYPTSLFGQVEQESKNLLTLYMEENGITSTFEGVVSLCNTIGIQPPERQTSEQWEEFIKQVERRERLLSKMRKALQQSQQGEQLKEYLHTTRGYSDELIAKMGIVCITPEIAEEMRGDLSRKFIPEDYLLAIPYYSSGRLFGFIFRDITGKHTGGDKYLNTIGLPRGARLFGLTGLKLTGNKEKDRTLTIVEGQLDALHAQAAGLENVVATGGVSLSVEALTEAKKFGVERIILVLDTEGDLTKDAQRDKDRVKALRTIQEAGLEGYIATLPSDEGKTDVDSYLNNHTKEQLGAVLEQAENASLFLYRLLEEEALAKYQAQQQTEIWSETNISDYKRAVLQLVNDPITKPTDRDRIYKAVSDFTQGSITPEAIQEEADALRAVEDAKRQRETAQKVVERASTLTKAGQTDEALNYLQTELPKLREISRETEFAQLLTTPTEEAFRASMQRIKEGLHTGYTFGKGKDAEELILPSGAVSLICAPTSHGKSTLLQNIALQAAQQDSEEGAVVYFTFEEEESSVTLQFLNKYLNTEITRQYDNKRSNNLRTLGEYYRTGATDYIRKESIDTFRQKEPEFFKLLTSGKLRIFRRDWDSDTLCSAIRYLCKQIKVKAVFVDYIQLLRIKNYKGDRRAELCEISSAFNNLAIDLSIPVVMAAQLNRKAGSPLDMHSQNLAEAADLERYANTIVSLWNTSFKATTERGATDKELSDLEKRMNFTLGTGGKIYSKIMKNRGGSVGLEAVFNFDGNTGVISQTAQTTKVYF